jgi:four helix bundle protein
VLAGVQGLRSRFARRAPEGRALDSGCDSRAVGGYVGEAGEKESFMAFQVEEYAYELIAAVQPAVVRIRQQDKSLADQLMRAASSIALNIAESSYSDPGNRRARLFTAAGSANETRAALRVATSRAYFKVEEVGAALRLLDRIVAILWSLTHR